MTTINTIAELNKLKKNFIVEKNEEYTSYKLNGIKFSEEYTKEESKTTIKIENHELKEKSFTKTKRKIINKLLEFSKNELNEREHNIEEFKNYILSEKFENFLKFVLQYFFKIIKSNRKIVNKKEHKYVKIDVINILHKYIEIQNNKNQSKTFSIY